jgi:hypothetical protein
MVNPSPIVQTRYHELNEHLIAHSLHHLYSRIDASYAAHSDIYAFFQQRFMELRRRQRLPNIWPGADMLNALMHRAGRHFIWAESAMTFIKEE